MLRIVIKTNREIRVATALAIDCAAMISMRRDLCNRDDVHMISLGDRFRSDDESAAECGFVLASEEPRLKNLSRARARARTS
jgi:hypothetical protein